MASFLYIGDSQRVYPDQQAADGSTLDVSPGDVVEAEENPDPRRFDPITGDQPHHHHHASPSVPPAE